MRKRKLKCAKCDSKEKSPSQYYCRKCKKEKYQESGHLNQWLTRILYRYNITKKEAIKLYNKSNCDICQEELLFDRSNKQKCVDHDHKTDKVRGVLCNSCNAGLGMFKDSPLILNKAINYLNENI